MNIVKYDELGRLLKARPDEDEIEPPHFRACHGCRTPLLLEGEWLYHDC